MRMGMGRVWKKLGGKLGSVGVVEGNDTPPAAGDSGGADNERAR